jgi:hypothetical protein
MTSSLQRQLLMAGLAVIVAGCGTLWLTAADPAPNKIEETEVLMRAKLSSSQKVLEGLLAKNFALIAEGAIEMKKISEAAEWPRTRDEVYEHYSAEFRRQCNKLESLAAKENHEGATFTYLHMTTTCLDCHNYVRDALRVAIEPNGHVQLVPAPQP